MNQCKDDDLVAGSKVQPEIEIQDILKEEMKILLSLLFITPTAFENLAFLFLLLENKYI